MTRPQPGILAEVPTVARFVTLGLVPDADARAALARLSELRVSGDQVIGVGAPLVLAAGHASVLGLRGFPALVGPGCNVPSTQGAAWLFFRGEDPGEVLHSTRATLASLGGAFRVEEDTATFRYAGGRDLSGYEDGTENPEGERAREVAIRDDGASFVAAQRWLHDLAHFEDLAPAERDAIIGRSRTTNEELAGAPESAHVKRAAQESFDPEAFMLRRSMPFGGVGEHGLYFVAFGASLDPFERVLRRMVGLEDGIVDGLFRFSRPVSGGHYWCPPITSDERLELAPMA